MRLMWLVILAVIGTSGTAGYAQEKSPPSATSAQNQVSVTGNIKQSDRVVLSSESTTVRVADPNETVAINGRVMKVADLMAVLSSDNLLEQRLHNQANQIPAGSQQVPQPQKI